MGVLSHNFMRLTPSVIYRGSVFYLCDGEFIQCDLDGMDLPIEYKPYFNGWMPYIRYSDKALSMSFSQEEIGKIYKRLSDMAFEMEVLDECVLVFTYLSYFYYLKVILQILSLYSG